MTKSKRDTISKVVDEQDAVPCNKEEKAGQCANKKDLKKDMTHLASLGSKKAS